MDISFLLTKSARDLSIGIMPTSWLVSITRSNCLGRLSLMSVLTAVVAIITSTAGMRPPRTPCINRWEMTPDMVLAN